MMPSSRFSSRRITFITFLGLSFVSLVAGGLGATLLVKAIERSHARIELASNAEYGRRFVSMLEAELGNGESSDTVLGRFQGVLQSSPGDGSRYICVLRSTGEVLCHPKSNVVGNIVSTEFQSMTSPTPMDFTEWVKQGQLEGLMLRNGRAVELIRRFPIGSTGWQVLVHTKLDSLRAQTRELSFTILSVMIPTGFFFILLGTMVVRWIGRNYELEIEQANMRLEERVNARTAELQQTVDELRQTRQALDLREKMALLGQLIAGIAHEINNPLNVIAIQASNLREVVTDEDERRAAEAIQRNALRCGQLVKNMLAYARNEAPSRSPLSVRELVETSLALATGEAIRHRVVMDLELPVDDVEVGGDRIQLEQVLLNLLGNAAQALGSKMGDRRVLLRVAREGQQVAISVEDNGPGLPAAIREHLFEPFQTTKSGGQGTGLGLSLCRRFVEAHGGSIEYKQSRLGGACFEVRLPVLRREAIAAGG